MTQCKQFDYAGIIGEISPPPLARPTPRSQQWERQQCSRLAHSTLRFIMPFSVRLIGKSSISVPLPLLGLVRPLCYLRVFLGLLRPVSGHVRTYRCSLDCAQS